MTLVELKEKLAARVDEVTIVELLDLRTGDIVEAFSDKVEEKMDELLELVEDDIEDE